MTGCVVLSLCDRTGNMVRPWAEAGYRCITVDLQEAEDLFPNREHIVMDVRDLASALPVLRTLSLEIVFAFPPCTNLANSGARWWSEKGLDGVISGLEVANACRRIAEGSGAPWLIENPVGALATHWRKPDHSFDPCDFAGYAPDPSKDAYTKRTCFWVGGGLIMPRRKPVEAVLGSLIHRMSRSEDRGDKRAVTPLGLAYAVFQANESEWKFRNEQLEEVARYATTRPGAGAPAYR